MINEHYAHAYCCEDISKIENYNKAIADNTQTWDCHHRAEITENERRTKQELIDDGIYWNRPAEELIFIPHSQHMSNHLRGRKLSNEVKKRMSLGRKGKRRGIPTWNKGKHWSAETKAKLSAAMSGENHPWYGKHLPEAMRKRQSEARKGFRWFNNGSEEICTKECPEGFAKGRLKRHR